MGVLENRMGVGLDSICDFFLLSALFRFFTREFFSPSCASSALFVVVSCAPLPLFYPRYCTGMTPPAVEIMLKKEGKVERGW